MIQTTMAKKRNVFDLPLTKRPNIVNISENYGQIQKKIKISTEKTVSVPVLEKSTKNASLNQAHPMVHTSCAKQEYDQLYGKSNFLTTEIENARFTEMMSSLDTDFSQTENRSKGGWKISHYDKNIERMNQIRLINQQLSAKSMVSV